MQRAMTPRETNSMLSEADDFLGHLEGDHSANSFGSSSGRRISDEDTTALRRRSSKFPVNEPRNRRRSTRTIKGQQTTRGRRGRSCTNISLEKSSKGEKNVKSSSRSPKRNSTNNPPTKNDSRNDEAKSPMRDMRRSISAPPCEEEEAKANEAQNEIKKQSSRTSAEEKMLRGRSSTSRRQLKSDKTETNGSSIRRNNINAVDGSSPRRKKNGLRRESSANKRKRSTALNTFDKSSNSSAESFRPSLTEDDEARRMAAKVSEDIGGSRSDSSNQKKDRTRSVSLNPKDIQMEKTGDFENIRSVSLGTKEHKSWAAGLNNVDPVPSASVHPKRASNSQKVHSTRPVSLKPKRESKSKKTSNHRSASLGTKRESNSTKNRAAVDRFEKSFTSSAECFHKGRNEDEARKIEKEEGRLETLEDGVGHANEEVSPFEVIRSVCMNPKRESNNTGKYSTAFKAFDTKNNSAEEGTKQIAKEARILKLTPVDTASMKKFIITPDGKKLPRGEDKEDVPLLVSMTAILKIEKTRGDTGSPRPVSSNQQTKSNNDKMYNSRSASLNPKRDGKSKKIGQPRSASLNPKKEINHNENSLSALDMLDKKYNSSAESFHQSTALNMFDKSHSSAESFQESFCKDESRRIVKEAGFLEASEYIGGSRSTSLSRKKENSSEGKRNCRSASLNPKRENSSQNFHNPRSASLHPKRESNSKKVSNCKSTSQKQKKKGVPKRESKIYLPSNPSRCDHRRRWSLTGTLEVGGEEKGLEDEISVGKTQNILDVIASPTTSRPSIPRTAFHEKQKNKSPSDSNNRQRRCRSESIGRRRQEDNSPTSPSTLPSLLSLSTCSDHGDENGDSKQNLLENISIDDIMSSPTTSQDMPTNKNMSPSTDLWEPTPITVPFPEAELQESSDQKAMDASLVVMSGSSTANSAKPNAREGRRTSRRVRKIEGDKEKKERRLSPRRESERDRKDRGDKKDVADQKKSNQQPSTQAPQASSGLSKSKRQSSQPRTRSNSRSHSRTSRTRIENALAQYQAETEDTAFHRKATSMITPISDTDTGGESDASENQENVPKPTDAKRSSSLLETLYGGGKQNKKDVELEAEKLAGNKKSGKKNIRSASLSPMRKSNGALSMSGDLDSACHGESNRMVQSETGPQVRRSSRSLTPARPDCSKDRELMKRGGRNRLAKERKSRTTCTFDDLGGEDSDFTKSERSSRTTSTPDDVGGENSDVTKSDTDFSLDKSLSKGRGGRNKTPAATRRRRNTIGHDMLYKSLSSIPGLEPMSASDNLGHSSGPIPTVKKEQVWQTRRRRASLQVEE